MAWLERLGFGSFDGCLPTQLELPAISGASLGTVRARVRAAVVETTRSSALRTGVGSVRMRAVFVGIAAGTIALAMSCQCGEPTPELNRWTCESGADASVILGEGTGFVPRLAGTPDGFAAVVKGQSGDAIQFFNSRLEQQSAPFTLGDDAEQTAVSPFDESVVVTWQRTDVDAGIDHLYATRLSVDGGEAFRQADGGVLFEVVRQRNLATGFIEETSRDRACILLTWGDSCAGVGFRAMTIGPTGAALSTVHDFVPISPPQCHLDGPRRFIPYGDSGFALLADGPSSLPENRTVQLRLFDCEMNELPPPQETALGALPDDWSIFPADVDGDPWLILSRFVEGHAFTLRRLADPANDLLEVDAGEASVAAQVLPSRVGNPFAVWVERDGMNGVRIRSQRIGGEQPVTLIHSGAREGWPLAVHGVPGMLVVATMLDGGSGTRIERADLFCEPP